MNGSPLPLAHLRVIELGSVVLAPYASQTLAELGARVIKVEPPEGDNTRRLGVARHAGMGALFLNCNRGKESVALDLKQPAGLQALKRLVAGADVLIHNMRAQAAARLGLAYEDLAGDNPRLIYCATGGYGSGGRHAGQPAYDDIIQAGTGLAALRGRIDGKPSYAPTIVVDKSTALYAVIGIMGALMQRAATGRGGHIEVSMFESMAHYMSIEHLGGCSFDPPAGPSGYARILNDQRRPHRTKDGYMAVLPYTTTQWKAFFDGAGRPEVLEDPRFCDDAGRTRHIDALYEVVSTVLPDRTNAQWIELCTQWDIPHSPVRDVADLLAEPHLADVGFWHRFEHPSEGPMVAPSFPVRDLQSAGHHTTNRPAPRLGEHTREVLRSLGYLPAEVDEMIGSGAARALAEGMDAA